VFGSGPYAVEKGGRMRWQSGLVGRRVMRVDVIVTVCDDGWISGEDNARPILLVSGWPGP
jgi:hypothetical protein